MEETVKKKLIDDGILKTEKEMDQVHLGHAKERGLINSWEILTNIRAQVNIFLERQPIFYDTAKLWWIWNNSKSCYEITDETEILLRISQTGKDTINTKAKTEILEALKQEGRKRIPLPFKKEWIQFKDEIIDFHTGNKINASPIFFCTNPIPWKISGDPRTPTIDKIFKEWVGESMVKVLHQILAYCLITNYPINIIFCLIGSGMNGKSCFLNLIKKFVGLYNVTTTELDTLIGSRFEITKLHKKLVCLLGETNFNEISRTSMLKKLSGGDLIGFEYKHKTPFDEHNYAKIIIATNNLPTTTDKTAGFYRRWYIIDFPNNFSEKKDILSEIPEEEYDNLATQAVLTLKELLEVREFHNQGTVEERTRRYEEKSNPFEKFWKDNVEEEPITDIPNWEFAKTLNEWCRNNKFRELGDRTIAQHMKEKGIETKLLRKEWFDQGFQTTKPIRCWIGVKWKN
jgi:putative DNA primase/helicase